LEARPTGSATTTVIRPGGGSPPGPCRHTVGRFPRCAVGRFARYAVGRFARRAAGPSAALVAILAVALIFASVPPSFPAAAAAGDIALEIGGVSVETDVPPIIVDGRTLVPVRVVSENLGASVDWDAATQTVIIVAPTKRIILPVGRPIATVNGETIILDVPARIVSGRTMVPIRFVSEALDAAVDWVPEERLVTVFLPQPSASTAAVLRW